jgi:hypothetical protein
VTSPSQFDEEFSGLLDTYSDTISQFRETLTDASYNDRDLLKVFSRHARAMADELNAHFSFLEDSRPADPVDIRRYMIYEMDLLWRIRDILVEDLGLFDESFRIVVSRGVNERLKGLIFNELNSMQINVKETLADNIRAAWDALSDKSVSSRQRVESWRTSVQSVRHLADSWFALSENLDKAFKAWKVSGSASI